MKRLFLLAYLLLITVSVNAPLFSMEMPKEKLVENPRQEDDALEQDLMTTNMPAEITTCVDEVLEKTPSVWVKIFSSVINASPVSHQQLAKSESQIFKKKLVCIVEKLTPPLLKLDANLDNLLLLQQLLGIFQPWTKPATSEGSSFLKGDDKKKIDNLCENIQKKTDQIITAYVKKTLTQAQATWHQSFSSITETSSVESLTIEAYNRTLSCLADSIATHLRELGKDQLNALHEIFYKWSEKNFRVKSLCQSIKLEMSREKINLGQVVTKQKSANGETYSQEQWDLREAEVEKLREELKGLKKELKSAKNTLDLKFAELKEKDKLLVQSEQGSSAKPSPTPIKPTGDLSIKKELEALNKKATDEANKNAQLTMENLKLRQDIATLNRQQASAKPASSNAKEQLPQIINLKNLIQLYHLTGEHEKTRTLLENLQKQQVDDAKIQAFIWRYLGELHYYGHAGLKQNDKLAFELFNKVACQNDDKEAKISAHYHLGKIYQNQKEIGKAEEHFIEAAAEHAEAILSLGDLYCEQKKYSNALIWYEKACKQNKNAKVRCLAQEKFLQVQSIVNPQEAAKLFKSFEQEILN